MYQMNIQTQDREAGV